MSTSKMIAVERLIAAALAFVGFKEVDNNRGQVVERFLKETGLPGGYSWCAAFVYHVGYWSQYDEITRKSQWPLPATAGCKDLGKFATARKVLFDVPERGDVFLKYFPNKGRFAHAGIILIAKRLPDGTFDCLTVEGNTNNDGSREGNTTLIKARLLAPIAGDRFIRWTAL